MKKKDSTFWNMLWSLTLITAVAGGLLGYTHRLTQEPIARATKAGREKAIQQVIPKYDNSPIDEQCSYTVRNLSLIHISEPTRQAEISYAVFCLKKKKKAQRR